jgi:hypothetical protein
MNTGMRRSAAMLTLIVMVLTYGCGGGGHSSTAGATEETTTPVAPQSGADTSRIISASLPLCKTGVTYEANSATHAPAAVKVMDGGASYSFAVVSGSLAEGLTMDEAGTVSGKTNGPAGRYVFTLKVTDRNTSSHTFYQEMALVVSDRGKVSQPYEEIRKNPRAYYVHQEAAMCGPTSFYMILKYHGDTRPGSGPTNADLCETIPGASSAVVNSSTKVYAHLTSFSSSFFPGTEWSDLEDGSSSLRKDALPLYSCIQSNPEGSENDAAGAQERETIFETDLVPFLESGSPVLVHLKRPYGASGHYLVVIGYDPGTGEVMYLDPNDPGFDPRVQTYAPDSLDWSQVVRKVGRDAFTGTAWYSKSGYLDAFWDGRWLGFFH